MKYKLVLWMGIRYYVWELYSGEVSCASTVQEDTMNFILRYRECREKREERYVHNKWKWSVVVPDDSSPAGYYNVAHQYHDRRLNPKNPNDVKAP